ncbi:MAG: DUF370 domain-containing protein [Dehalococcoidales bacterium]|nr:DUF370 domain-containing protein [Dehalococcoidales bacterium]
MSLELVHIGFNNIIVMNRVIAIGSPNSAPTKRTIQEGRTKGLLVDMTNGRRTKAVIITDSGHIILAALTPETIAGRLQINHAEGSAERGSSVLSLGHSNERIPR